MVKKGENPMTAVVQSNNSDMAVTQAMEQVDK